MGRYTSMVLSGAGVLGTLYAGTFTAYDKVFGDGSISKDFKRVVGVSSGSIFATLVSLAMSADEIREEAVKLDYANFAEHYKDFSFSFAEALSLIENDRDGYGLNTGDFIRQYVDDTIYAKLNKHNATFADLYSYGNKELHVLVTDLIKSNLICFSHKDTPDMIVSDAVRMSCGFPIFFDVVKSNNSVFVDGGMLDAIPIAFFPDRYEIPSDEILCMTPSCSDVKEYLSSEFSKILSQDADNAGSFGWKEYISSLFKLYSVSSWEHAIQVANLLKIDLLSFSIPKGVSSLNFNITQEQKINLLNEGEKVGLDFFRKKKALC